jgi:hypothetical protein
MNTWAKMACVGASLWWNATNATTLDQQTVEDARTFLAGYLELNNTQKISLLPLYADDAVINVTVVTLDREVRTLELSGHKWKQLLRETWYNGQPSAEPMQLHDIKIKPISGDTLEITAHRYTLKRCYWDNRYRLVIAKTAARYLIIGETVLIDHQNRCEPPETTIINQEITIIPPTKEAHQ